MPKDYRELCKEIIGAEVAEAPPFILGAWYIILRKGDKCYKLKPGDDWIEIMEVPAPKKSKS